jgi:hypothetical protein
MSIIQSFKEHFAEEELNKKLAKQKEEFEKLIILQKEELSKENEELRNNLNELQNIVSKKEEKKITVNRQLLLLHYLGILDNFKFPTKEKKYDLFHLIIDKNRQAVKNFSNYRDQPKKDEFQKIFNEEDLYFISDLFKEVGLEKQKIDVDTDIIKFKF